MIYQTAAEYRAALFAQLEQSGLTRNDHIARLWAVLKDDPERLRRLYEALNHWAFSYPEELKAQGCRKSEVAAAHDRALLAINLSAGTIIGLCSHLDEWEEERRRAEVQRMNRQMELILTEGIAPSD